MRFVKVTGIVLLIAVLCCTFSGCELRLGSPQELLRPPRLTGENESLQLAFEKYVGSSPSLKAPLSGDYQSSFVIEDIDGDSRAEALAFYLSPSDNTTVRMCFLDCNASGEWRVVTDIKGSGSDIYSLRFCDVNSDGIKDILVSWSLFENKLTRILNVYGVTSSDGYVTAVTSGTSEYYSLMKLYDADDDAVSELFLLTMNDTLEIPRYTLTLYDFNSNCSLSKTAEYNMNPGISTVSEININQSAGGTGEKYILIDSLKNDTLRVTDVITYVPNSTAFIPLTPSPAGELSRSVSINCFDPDGDGYYEIPVHTDLPGNAKDRTLSYGNTEYALDCLRFYSANSSVLTVKYSAVYDSFSRWLFLYTWRTNEVTVRYLPDEGNAVMFSRCNPYTNETYDDLFSICFFAYDTPFSDGYSFIAGNSLGSFGYRLTDVGAAAGIDLEFIKANFIIL